MIKSSTMVMNKRRFENQRLSLDNFFSIVYEFQKDISSAEDFLSSIYIDISIGEEIDTDQCSNIINLLQRLKEPVQRFYRFLETASHLPNVIRPLRYRLLIGLHYVDKLSSMLISALVTFRGIYRSLSSEVTMQRQEILRQLALLVQSSEEILQNIEILHLQVLSRTGCPATVLGKRYNLGVHSLEQPR
jgi:hypothetical protein